MMFTPPGGRDGPSCSARTAGARVRAREREIGRERERKKERKKEHAVVRLADGVLEPPRGLRVADQMDLSARAGRHELAVEVISDPLSPQRGYR